jgi:2-polyprenyl-6-methoxyphenol hydroxylase-like FAD-dependent oxidoreductase
MADVERILIVGGGIAGLSLATALHRQGFAAELVERSPSWQAVGAGIVLMANGVRVLQELGVGDAVEQAGTPIRRVGLFDQHGRALCSTNLREMWREVGPCVGIARTRLQEALLIGAAPVPARLGVSVTSLTQEQDRVLVQFDDGSRAEYDLVVGADGIYSTVRRLALTTRPPQYAGTMVWRSIVPIRPDGISDLTILLGDGCYFGQVPLGDGHTYGFAAVGGSRLDDPFAGRLERVRHRFGGFGGPVPAYLAALERDAQLHVGPFEWMDLGRWHRGRVALIGDAAHAGPPNMAEGGCMALEDAIVLAEELCAADTVESALDRYVARRRPRADWVQEQSRLVADAWIKPAAVRNAILRERGDQLFRDRYQALLPAA